MIIHLCIIKNKNIENCNSEKGTDCTGSCKSNYHTFTTMTAPFWSMVFNATFNNISVISWRSALLVEETRVTGGSKRPVTSQ